MTDLSARVRTSANNHVRGILIRASTQPTVHAKLLISTHNVDIIRHKRINDQFLKRVPSEMSESATHQKFTTCVAPPLNDPGNVILRNIRHVEIVGPCSLGKREETIEFRTEIAYLSQCTIMNENFLEKFFEDLQLPIC